MALAVFVIGGVNHLYLETRLLSELEQELDRRAVGLAQQMSHQAVSLILYDDRVGLQELVDHARTQSPDFAYAFVVDPAGRILAHSFTGSFPSPLRLVNRHRSGHGPNVERIEVLGETFRDLALPLHRGDLGALRLGVRDKRILARIAQIQRELLLILLAGALAAAAVAYLFTGLGLRPFAAIVDTLARFRPGQHREAIAIDRNDEIGDLAAQINDVTARLHETQGHLLRAERLASVGVMASGVAHEIANPITGIQNCLRRIQARPGDARQTKEYADAMLSATDHIAAVVRGLLDFSRGRPQRIRRIDLRDVIERSIDLAALKLQEQRIDLVRHVPDAPVWTRGDEAQLVQVLVNLVLNAIDAMPAGGNLTVSIHAAGAQAVVRVADRGIGIPAADLERVFDPFFTTKEAGKGTGLGLAVSHGIVDDHSGTIDVRSAPGEGTEVTVGLPLDQGGASHGRA